eukprot:TRINITY_DN170_c0_g1_i1.p1 TRINITY_DN170_c0_g1~~TRINITY_DN170_c0_g1_i1.p1  ORF type:complete len:324 (-),score=32.86 TRINITY_DN170_c0_g1_i1:122-1093(-)
MKVAIALLVTFAFALCAVESRILFIDQFPHFQTFDNWDLCYYDGTCYELSCPNLQSGWYNPTFRATLPNPPEIRNWWVIDQQTPSNWAEFTRDPVECTNGNVDNLFTGPCTDHTSKVANKGKYLYAEATACFQSFFDVVTPTFMFSNTGALMSFYYYFYGTNIDGATFQAQISIDNGTWTDVYQHTVTGNGLTSWRYIAVDLDPFLNNATADTPVPATFRFRALTGQNYYSDMAIDDVYWTQDGAANSSSPYIEPNRTSAPPPNIASPIVTKEGGDGLSDGEIAGIVVGIVGGVCCLCCCLCLCLIAMVIIISPRKPPQEASG